jgi:hypothetical protein
VATFDVGHLSPQHRVPDLAHLVAGDQGGCAGLAGTPLHICQEEENLHAPLGAFFIIVLWVFADVILPAIGFVLARLRRTPRPPP